MDMNLVEDGEMVEDVVHGVAKNQTQFSHSRCLSEHVMGDKISLLTKHWLHKERTAAEGPANLFSKMRTRMGFHFPILRLHEKNGPLFCVQTNMYSIANAFNLIFK